MIDPTNDIKFDRSKPELEEYLLFCISVAGKTAHIIAQKIDQFLGINAYRPFDYIRELCRIGQLRSHLERVKLGKYDILEPCFRDLAFSDIDLRTCSTDELEHFRGIGPKTSRFFILHSRPDQQLVPLDTHILKHLRDQGYSAPRNTPGNGKRYRSLERVVIDLAIEANMSVAKYDAMIWNRYSKFGAK